MHIEALKVFCDVVETGSFSAAASQNLITQSAVSQQLRTLESRYRCKLLERGRGGAKPTPQGEILYRASREIVERFQALETELQRSGHIVAGQLRVAIVYSVGLHELPPYLKSYLREYPEVTVHVEYSRSNRIYEGVVAGQIDLGFVAYPQRHPQIAVVPIREDVLVVACAPEHPLAGETSIRPEQLDGEAAVGFERDIATRKATDHFLRSRHVTLRYVTEFDNIETIKRAVEIGQGLAIVPLAAVRHEVEHGLLKAIPLEGEPLRRPLGIVHKKGRPLSPAAEKFIETLRRDDLG